MWRIEKIIDEAKNSNIDLKSFLVGEAVQNEYEQQLDQLKTENEELKKEIAFGNNGTLSDKIRAIVFKDLNKENNKLKQTLADIKEIAKKENNDTKVLYNRRTYQRMKQILQKINEVYND